MSFLINACFTPRVVLYRIFFTCACLMQIGTNSALGHEHEHTHASLTRAAVRYLDSDILYNNVLNTWPGYPTLTEIEEQLVQGVIDEDECLELDDTGSGRSWEKNQNWNSHFYEPKTGKRLSILIGAVIDDDCIKIDTDFTTATDRASRLWVMAMEDFRAEKYISAYRILGRVLHLLQDMTSPSHVHDNPHGQARDVCGNDSDDFEQWGYCEDNGEASHITDYFHVNTRDGDCSVNIDGVGPVEHFGTPPAGISCRLWAGLQRLYEGESQGRPYSKYKVNPSMNIAFDYVRYVSNVTYDFTTFAARLKDDTNFTDVQPDSELKRMLRGGTSDDCGAFTFDYGLCEFTDGFGISGEFQEIGFTEGKCGSVEHALPDTLEEWNLMETGCHPPSPTPEPSHPDERIGFAFIENVGGDGPHSGGDFDSFIPLRYGCNTSVDGGLCRATEKRHPFNKVLYQDLYGTTSNRVDPFYPEPRKGKTLLRIYGDILYPTAVAYSAGLIEEFIVEASQSPTADAGGPYEEEACQLLTLDGSGSSDRNENGSIVSYEWDFTDDGTFDTMSAEATIEHAYADVFDGQTRLRVTDDEGFTGEDTADVLITPDVTPPVLEEIRSDPPYLWPPNHKMVSVTVSVKTADACDEQVVCRITKVTSNQSVTGQNDHTTPDWIIMGDLTVGLRAERFNDVPKGKENNGSNGVQAREYELSLRCADAAGNSANGQLIVPVNKSAADNRAITRHQ